MILEIEDIVFLAIKTSFSIMFKLINKRILQGMSQLPILGIGLYLIWSISSLGLLFDNSIYGWVNELLRSIVCLVVYHTFGGWKGFVVPALLINVIYGVSLAISTLSITAYLLSVQNKELKQEATQIGSKKKTKKIN